MLMDSPQNWLLGVGPGNFRQHYLQFKLPQSSEEIADPHNLNIQLEINGEILQNSNTRELIFKIPDLIAFLSSVFTLEPGDIVSTGTVSGVAGFRENAAEMYLRPGDVVECEIEKIGTLSNPVISWEQAYGVPAPPMQRW